VLEPPFRTSTPWCGWDNKGSCYGSSSHLQFAHGQLYDNRDRIVPGAIYFNGCARDGGCHASGSDGVGFGTTAGHTYFEGKCYGACWNHAYAGFYFGNKSEINGPLTYWYRAQIPPTVIASNKKSCLAFKNAGNNKDGVYQLNNGINVYCDMTTSGGGWMLLLTQLDGRNQYEGSVSPFVHSVAETYPSPKSAYSRNWKFFTPQKGNQFMLKNNAMPGRFIRFEQGTTWCGWDNKGGCHGSSSHLQFAHGTTYDETGKDLGIPYFNGCARDGGCHASGSDGVGFGTTAGHTYFEGKCYGACWNHSYAGFYWGTKTEQAGPMTYWYRPN
jgi:hypothetical protein